MILCPTYSISAAAATQSHIDNLTTFYNSVVKKLTLLSGIYSGTSIPLCSEHRIHPYIPQGPPIH